MSDRGPVTTTTAMTIPMVGELTMLDTNVLLTATEPGRRGHAQALALLTADTRLGVSPQIMREYLSVATRPQSENGMGLRPEAAAANASSFLERCDLLAETVAVVQRLLALLPVGPTLGRQVHDANIVATALAHGVHRIVTDNVRHFARFADLIEIVPLA